MLINPDEEPEATQGSARMEEEEGTERKEGVCVLRSCEEREFGRE